MLSYLFEGKKVLREHLWSGLTLFLSCADDSIQYFQRHLTHDPLNKNNITRQEMLHTAKFLIALYI